jgi:ParB-like chromosome segregation protein Spo0J
MAIKKTNNVPVKMKLDNLIPYHLNMLDHSSEQVEQLASIIAHYGFRGAIWVDENNVIIKGHGSRLACQKLGMTEVDVIVIKDLSPSEIRALRIADNAISYKSSVNRENLISKLSFLKDEDFNLKLTGYDENEIKLFIEDIDLSFDEDEGEGKDEVKTSQTVEQSHTQEIDPEDYEFEHQCPKCGFEW